MNKIKKASFFVKRFFLKPYEYDFYQAVSLLKSFISNSSLGDLKETKFGIINPSIPIKFKSTVHYANPSTDIKKIEIKTNLKGFLQPILWVNFTGIAGVQGPLPLAYTEMVFRNIRNKDNALASFLDIFNNRIISLFYDLKSSVPGYIPGPPQSSPIGKILKSFGGLELGEERSDVEKYLINYKNMFWQRIRSSSNLKQILQSFFESKIQVFENIGAFSNIDEEYITKIGDKKGSLYTLGNDAYLGNRIWNQSNKIKIIICDIDDKKYETFNPYYNGENLKHLIQLCKVYSPDSLKINFFLQIDQKFKKATILSDNHNLGFNTWLGVKITDINQPVMIRIN